MSLYYIIETYIRKEEPVYHIPPVFSAYQKPYLVGILPKNIEIKIAEPQATVQLITLDKPRLIAVGSSTK